MSSTTDDKEREFLDIKEAAEFLELPSVALLRKWVSNREITCYRWSTRVLRFRRSDLEAFKKKNGKVSALVSN